MCAAPRLLIASTNPHKLQEFREIFVNLPYELVSPTELDVRVSIEETGTTFAQNAVLKALAYADAAGMLTLADDSGLEIDALGGEPGIYSARWAGIETPYEERFRILAERLAEVSEQQRTARYRAAIAVAQPAPYGLYDVVEGTLEGRIVAQPRGTGGFGYDPIFYVPELGKTVGELSSAQKHRISHRARAAAQARDVLLRLRSRTEASSSGAAPTQ